MSCCFEGVFFFSGRINVLVLVLVLVALKAWVACKSLKYTDDFIGT